jgi:hypothetical protein
MYLPCKGRKEKRKKRVPTNSILDEKKILKKFGYRRVRPEVKGLPHLRLLWVMQSIEGSY